MDKWVMCVVLFLLGMLSFHLLKGVCGCKNVEGQLLDLGAHPPWNDSNVSDHYNVTPRGNYKRSCKLATDFTRDKTNNTKSGPNSICRDKNNTHYKFDFDGANHSPAAFGPQNPPAEYWSDTPCCSVTSNTTTTTTPSESADLAEKVMTDDCVGRLMRSGCDVAHLDNSEPGKYVHQSQCQECLRSMSDWRNPGKNFSDGARNDSLLVDCNFGNIPDTRDRAAAYCQGLEPWQYKMNSTYRDLVKPFITG
jgi:hypothetical protein